MIQHNWTTEARRALLGLRGKESAWGYRDGAAPAPEPTALAALALLATGSDTQPSRLAADWLARSQRDDGSLGISGDKSAVASPGWMTPYAMLVWALFPAHAAALRRGSHWLLGIKGRTLDPKEDPARIAGHNTMLVGWPWVGDTHSWLEPTAIAVLALGRDGFETHPRVLEGLRLIRDRAIDSGGWNYGNKAVFGRSLRAQPAPTGLALLALDGIDPRTPLISKAVDYLTKSLPGVRACASLGWGVIGLRARGVPLESADAWLAESFEAVRGKPDAAPKLALLLLAAGDSTLGLFGRSANTTQDPSQGTR